MAIPAATPAYRANEKEQQIDTCISTSHLFLFGVFVFASIDCLFSLNAPSLLSLKCPAHPCVSYPALLQPLSNTTLQLLLYTTRPRMEALHQLCE